MSQAIPHQHPAVVLRSHYRHLRTLLAIAMVAVVGLSTAVVILATDDDTGTSTSISSTPASPMTTARPDESAVAQSLSRAPAPTATPDRAKAAATETFFRRTVPEPSRPDESGVAAAISGR